METSAAEEEKDPPMAAGARQPRTSLDRLHNSGAAASPSPPPSWLEIRLFYVRISPCAPDAVPPHLTLSHLRRDVGVALEINGARVPASDPSSVPLRRDRLDRDAAEVTYVSTDGVRLTGAVKFEVSDDRGNLILCGSLDRMEAPLSNEPVHHPGPSSSDKDPKTGWSMDCYSAASIGSSAFVQPKLGISSPSIEVYVAGCFAGSPLILTQTVYLSQRRKAARTGNLDSIPEDDEASGREQRSDEGLHRRKTSSSSSVMEPFHNKPSSQAQMGQTYPFQLIKHPQYHSQFAQSSPTQSQFQFHTVQSSSIAQMLPQPHYQPLLNSQSPRMQSQCQSQKQLQAQEQSQFQEQSQCQSQTIKKGTPNKRWKPHYDDFLIPFLVEQAREGMKVDKTFKRQAFVAAALAVNGRFRESFTWENVDNHMRTLKTKYQEIKKCREFSGAGWNDDLKMITLDEATYQTYIEANPKAKDYINKPIENYEGLKIVCGDDPITGYYKKNIFQQFGTRQTTMAPKAIDAIDLDQEPVGHDEEVEAPAADSTCTEQHPPTTPQDPTQATLQAPTRSSSSMNGRASGKRPRENIEAVIMELARKVGDVADAINNARPTHWTAELYERIMDLDEFEATIQEAAFDTLRRDEAEARAFIVKNKIMRRSWMERFMAERLSD